jgi:glutamine amidotransferase
MKNPAIAVIDYGMGNLRSVAKALELVGANALVTSDPAVINRAQAVVFPGVGSFKPAIKNVRAAGVKDALLDAIDANKPFLGICLGFQLLFDSSEEEGISKGLGIIPGKVVKFDFSGRGRARFKGLKIPHMGWNTVRVNKKNGAMFAGIPDNAYFYFVHSFYGMPDSSGVISGTTAYGIDFCSAVAKDRVWACQFHPEKSGDRGLRLLKNFVREAASTR